MLKSVYAKEGKWSKWLLRWHQLGSRLEVVGMI